MNEQEKIVKELSELKAELALLRSNLVADIAKGVVQGSILTAIILIVFSFLIRL